MISFDIGVKTGYSYDEQKINFLCKKMKNIIKTTFRENEIIFEITTKIYPKEVIYKTCYFFIDKVFIYLDIINKDFVAVSLKGKKNLSKKQLKNIEGEFLNELLNVLLRENVSKRNQKILEYIIGGAITASLPGNEKKVETSNIETSDMDLNKEIEILKKELEEIKEDDFENDPLGIKDIVGANKKNIVAKKRTAKK